MGREQLADPSLIGRTIAGKFTIDSFVGGGAMGAVYKAKQFALDKIVAIKVMHRDIAKDDKFVTRFKREAKAASRLDHPNSLRVIDFGEEPDGLLYLAMEFLDGKDLFAILKESWPLTDERMVDILMQALAALAVAHDQGIVHRDLKPENIMVLAGKDDEGRARDIVKVCDFGIAKITETRVDASESGRLSTKGLVVGTPEYMSPEQGRGESLDSRSDLYSMGVILYQLLTRRVPFDAESAIGIVLKHVTEEPVPPHEVYPNANPRLETVCLHAMQKKREDRYQTARELRADLRAALDGTITTHSVPQARQSGTNEAQRVSDSKMESAATIPVDVQKVASARSLLLEPTASKVTPIGTEALERPAGVPRAWTGYILALLLASVIGVGGYYLFRSQLRQSRQSAVAEPTPSETAAATPTNVATAPPMSTDVPTTPASVVGPPLIHTGVVHIIPTPSHGVVPPASASVVIAPAVSSVPAVTPPTAGGGEVRIGIPKNVTGDVDAKVIRAALTSAYQQYNACYVKGLKAGAKAQAYTADMHVKLGAQSSAQMAVPDFLSSAGQCIMSAATGALGGISGNGTAEVPMEFVPGN